MSARLRFLALREGVHKIDRLRVTGAADDFDFVMRWEISVRIEGI